MTKGIRGTFAKLGLVTDDTPAQPEKPRVAASVQQSFTPTPQPISMGSADPGMVATLKASVLGQSPVIKQFLENVEIARPQFPNDETACMRAALAFTRVEKSAIIEELNRTVSAALLHAKKRTETDRQKARDNAVGNLDREVAATDAEIKEMEGHIVELQQSIATKRTSLLELQGKIQSAEADLRGQDNVVNASFAQVEQYIALLGQTFARL